MQGNVKLPGVYATVWTFRAKKMQPVAQSLQYSSSRQKASIQVSEKLDISLTQWQDIQLNDKV